MPLFSAHLHYLFALIPLGHNYYLFFVLLFIQHSFPRPSRDHPERHCRVPIPFILVPFFIACSFFALLVPFLPPKGTTLHSTLCIFLFFSLQACIFFIYLVSFFVQLVFFFLYFSSKINTSYSSHLSVTRSTVFSVYCF